MLDCALVARGKEWYGIVHYPKLVPAMLRHTKEWRLLFQLPSVHEIGMEWGDDGWLYYCIHEADLRNRRFYGVWMICQCG